MDKRASGEGIELYGDHLVLDLMNTVMTVDGDKVERWNSDADVLAWLRSMLDPALELPAQAVPGSLAAARRLREQLRGLVMEHKDGGAPDLALLNGLLERAPRQLLVREEDGATWLGRRFAGDACAALLAPVVEAAAHLLTEESFERVKRCENPACTLWFFDRSKSQQRRWCSMALCGNRHKVATFRKRKAVA